MIYLPVIPKISIPVYGSGQVHIFFTSEHEKRRELRTVVVEVLVNKLQLPLVPKLQIDQNILHLNFSFLQNLIIHFDGETFWNTLSLFLELLISPPIISIAILSTKSIQHFQLFVTLILDQLFSFHLTHPNKTVIYTCDPIMLRMVPYQ